MYHKLGPNLPHRIIAADLRSNGTLDLVTADYLSNRVTVLLGNGDGTFQAPWSLSVPNAYWLAAGDFKAGGGEIVDVKIADLRDDGRNNLVVANASLSAVGVLLNNGDGTFAAVELYPTSLPGESTGAGLPTSTSTGS